MNPPKLPPHTISHAQFWFEISKKYVKMCIFLKTYPIKIPIFRVTPKKYHKIFVPKK